MAKENMYIFGPVPSRRLGLSLGVDIVPFKLCSLDCVYCQLGKTTEKTIERCDYVPLDDVLNELKERLANGIKPDFITISGSGEPTLNSQLGELIDEIKKITDIPVAILTNGTLLYRPDVRSDCAKADVVLPSLDAGDEPAFRKINRPHKDITFDKLLSGLIAFRKEYKGRIWLEVFLIEKFNTTTEQLAKIKDAIKLIGPDKVQLNTAVRPTAEPKVRKLNAQQLQDIALQLGDNCEVIADFDAVHSHKLHNSRAEDVLSMLKRRPCSLNDICSGLGLHKNEALKYLTYFQQQKTIVSERKDGVLFYKAN